MLPQGLTDALTATQSAKDTADSSLANKQATANALAQAQQSDQAAASDLAQKTAALDTSRRQLDALLDAYFQVGAPAPAVATQPAIPTVPPPAA